MPKKKYKDIDEWLKKRITDVGIREKLPPSFQQNNIDKCANIALELKDEKNLSSEQVKQVFEGCVVAIDINGESIESVKERLGLKSKRSWNIP